MAYENTDTSILKKVFTNIYENDYWSMGQTDSKSGIGSSDIYTRSIRENLKRIINTLKIKSVIDTSCGDWFWMKFIRHELACKYIGIDIVENIINKNRMLYGDNNTIFLAGDFLNILRAMPDNAVDLILCRHTCEHLPTDYNLSFILEAKRVSKYLLLTTKTTDELTPVNRDLDINQCTYRPINLQLFPYWDELHEYFVEKIYDGPSDKIDNEMFIHLYKFK